MKKIIAAVALLFAGVANAAHVVDYSWGAVSANKIEDLNYVELEGGFGKGGVDFYGFYDLNDDGSTFSKVNLSYTFDSNFLIEVTQKEFTLDEGLAFRDTFYGVGYKHSFDKGGFVKGSINTRDEGGAAILLAGSKPFIFGTSIDGWMDLVDKDGVEDFRGNVGIRKFVSDKVYARVATHWQKLEGESFDQQLHLQIGYNL